MKWVAKYTDGSELMQYEGDKENRYLDIDRNRLSSFALFGDSGELVLSVKLERPTQQLIYRRRVFTDLFGNQKDVIYLVGWHENIGGKSIKSICYIHSDGHIEMAGARDDLELITCEES